MHHATIQSEQVARFQSASAPSNQDFIEKLIATLLERSFVEMLVPGFRRPFPFKAATFISQDITVDREYKLLPSLFQAI
jgi:hypothetical protein